MSNFTGTGAEGIEKQEASPKKRQFNTIVFKRKKILWGLIIRGKSADVKGSMAMNKALGKGLSETEVNTAVLKAESKKMSDSELQAIADGTSPDTYGHWWIEINDGWGNGGSSYGWWPKESVNFKSTIFGVEGILNRGKKMDPHDGDSADEEFRMIVSSDDKRTLAQIIEEIDVFSLSFKSGWAYPARRGYDNCHSFQEKAIKSCKFYQKGKTEYKDNKGKLTKTVNTPKNVEEIN